MTLNAPDLDSFRWIHTQTSVEDRAALLTIREAICATKPTYEYLEVGSHLGGSLQPHIADARCAKIYSIDPRPSEQPDERYLGTFKYESNSTERMFEHLRKVPGADLSKVITFEKCSWDLPDDALAPGVDFIFVDGEHTNGAVLRDFAAVRRFLAPEAVLAFHDCYVTPAALKTIRKQIRASGKPATFGYYPSSNVVCIIFGASPRIADGLAKAGWQPEFPSFWKTSFALKWSTRREEIRIFIKSRFPRLAGFIRKLRGGGAKNP